MLAKAGIPYAKIKEKMDSHFRENDKSGFFICKRCFCVTSVINSDMKRTFKIINQ